MTRPDFSSARSVAGVSINDAAVATAPAVWMFMEQDGTPSTFAYAATNLGAMTRDSSVMMAIHRQLPTTRDRASAWRCRRQSSHAGLRRSLVRAP